MQENLEFINISTNKHNNVTYNKTRIYFTFMFNQFIVIKIKGILFVLDYSKNHDQMLT